MGADVHGCRQAGVRSSDCAPNFARRVISMLKNYVFTVITVALAMPVISCRHEVRADSKEPTLPVQVRTPAVVKRAESVSASGSVEGSETADVAFLVSGRVSRVLVEEGQHVTKGQLLAELEPTDYRNSFNAATAQ